MIQTENEKEYKAQNSTNISMERVHTAQIYTQTISNRISIRFQREHLSTKIEEGNIIGVYLCVHICSEHTQICT